ncbi:hypothetical protein MYX07_00795 [Patescibacteria group bacterium AH-259-L07]|nr:hypothetical protein [Patescibacteria group bacterium AH-259-L07]
MAKIGRIYKLNVKHKFILKDELKIDDSIVWELEIDAIIFRNEFDRYLMQFRKDKSEKTLVFVFIMLQIYLECFLHQNMRHIIGLEFKHRDELKYKKWIKNERLNIDDRKTEQGKLSLFIEYFSLENDPEVIVAKQVIERIFKKMTKIRNLLVHGHKISLAGNVDSSHIEVSEAGGYLNEDMLKEIFKDINQLGESWNKLLVSVLDKCRSLKKISDFKFDNLT